MNAVDPVTVWLRHERGCAGIRRENMTKDETTSRRFDVLAIGFFGFAVKALTARWTSLAAPIEGKG
jgi:hypothetical protein